MSPARRFLAVFALASVVLAGAASSADATFHLMKIREVSAGTGPADSSYAEVQMYAPFQNFLSYGATLVTCTSTCTSNVLSFAPFANVAHGDNQDTVVFGDNGLPAGSRDFNVDLNLDGRAAGGALCYLSEPGFSDCVSWGNFNENSYLVANYGTTAGTPAPALTTGMALRRSISAGCPSLLEASDDTNDSASDFSVTTPDPRPNSVTPTETPCAPSGGGGPPAGGSSQTTPRPKKKCKKAKKRAVAARKCKRK